MKKLLALFCSAILAGVALADTTIDFSKLAPVKEGSSFTQSSGNSTKYTLIFQNVTATSFDIKCTISHDYFASRSLTLLTLIGGSTGTRTCPFGKFTAPSVSYTSYQTVTHTNVFHVTGLEPDTIYWLSYVTDDSNDFSRWTSIQTSPVKISLGTVAVLPSFEHCAFSVPIAELGTHNESVRIDIVATGPDGDTHATTATVTKPGTVNMVIDTPALLGGTSYSAILTVTGDKTGTVTRDVSFVTLASPPTAGELVAETVEDVQATLSIPVAEIGVGNTYVDVLLSAVGADGSSVTGEVQRVTADGEVVQMAFDGLTPYTEYTATAVATASSGGKATATLAFTTRGSDPEIGEVFVMSQQDSSAAFLVPVNAFGAGNTEVTITAVATGDNGTSAESSTACTALGNNYATLSGLSAGTTYDVVFTVTGNHGGSTSAMASVTTTGKRPAGDSVVIDGNTLPTQWLIDNGIIPGTDGLTEEELIALWGTTGGNGLSLQDSYLTGLDPNAPLALEVSPVTAAPAAAACVFSVPVDQLGTGNASARIDIVAIGPDERTHSATATTTEPGTASVTLDTPPLLAGTEYAAIVTVSGNATGVVTQEVAFATLASAPVLGELGADAVGDVSATLSLPVTELGTGNTYVDVLITAVGVDGSSVTGEVQRVAADGGVAQFTLEGLTPYTQYTATATALASSDGEASATVAFTTLASNPGIGDLFVMSVQDTSAALLIPVNSLGDGNTAVTITTVAEATDGTRVETSLVQGIVGQTFAALTGLSPATDYTVTVTATGNHGGSATAATTLTTTDSSVTIDYVVINGDTLPTSWLLQNGVIDSADGMTEADLIGKWEDLAANGQTYHVCYVAGLDPADPDSVLSASIAMQDASPVVTWAPDLGAARTYTVEGKSAMTNAVWEGSTNSTHHFFRVNAALP